MKQFKDTFLNVSSTATGINISIPNKFFDNRQVFIDFCYVFFKKIADVSAKDSSEKTYVDQNIPTAMLRSKLSNNSENNANSFTRQKMQIPREGKLNLALVQDSLMNADIYMSNNQNELTTIADEDFRKKIFLLLQRLWISSDLLFLHYGLKQVVDKNASNETKEEQKEIDFVNSLNIRNTDLDFEQIRQTFTKWFSDITDKRFGYQPSVFVGDFNFDEKTNESTTKFLFDSSEYNNSQQNITDASTGQIQIEEIPIFFTKFNADIEFASRFD
jgi:hypothetical protein